MDLHVYDTEGNGLLDEITMLHCFVLQNQTDKSWKVFVDKKRYQDEKVADNYKFSVEFDLHDLSEITEFLSTKGKGYICHNQFGYDLQVFQKLGYIDSYGVAPDHINNVPVRLYDTLVMSRGLYPDRQLPLGCPTKVANSVTKKNDMVGPHGLHSWGFRVANAKPKVDDWRDQPLGVYINRCIEDVKINSGTWEYLLREMNDDTFGVNWKPAMQLLHRFDYRFKEQEKVGVAFDVEKGKQLVVDVDKMLEEIANDVEPLLPARPLPKTKQPKFPAKPFLKSGGLSASGFGYAAKFGIGEEGALEFIRSVQDGKPQPILTEPMRLSNQIDIKKFLVEVEGWEPTVFGTKDITRDEFKRLRSKTIIAEKAEEYLMKTILDSPYRKYLEEILGVRRGQGKQAFLDAVIKNARKLPTSPKLKDENGDLCPNLEKLNGDMATKIVKWLSLRSRRTVLLPLDAKKDTGWLNDSRVISEGRLTAGSAGLTNTYRQKHRGVRNVPKADPDVLLGKEMRQLFYAPRRRVFQTLDTSNMENMIAAWLAMPYDGGAYYDKVNTGDPHCYTGDVEILTEFGWQRFDELEDETFVAQVDDKNQLSYVQPFSVTRMDFEGEMYSFKGSHIDLDVTYNHRMVYVDKRKPKRLQIKKAKDLSTNNGSTRFVAGVNYTGGVLEIPEDLIELIVLSQADGSFSHNQVRIQVKKERKINKLRKVLENLGVDFHESEISEKGVRFAFNKEIVKDFLTEDKNFSESLLDLTPICREMFLGKIKVWDGWSNKNLVFYSQTTPRHKSVDLVQTLASLSGRHTKVSYIEESWGEISKRISYTKTGTDIPLRSLLAVDKVAYDYSGKVYCVSVPTTKILVRRNGKIVVSGNTDNAKAYSLAAGREVGRGEGKGITYGVLYGAQKDKVAKMLGISAKKAQDVINAFWDTNHGLKGLKKHLEDFWESTGQLFILGVDGRRLYTRSKHSLLNTRIQSTGAIMMDLAYCKAYDKLRDEDLLELSPIVIYYHDEISNEVSLSIIEEWCFDTEEEAKEFSVEGKVLSEVSHWKGDGKFYRYYSRSGEILKESVQEASLELGSPFMLTGEYAIGPDWSCTH